MPPQDVEMIQKPCRFCQKPVMIPSGPSGFPFTPRNLAHPECIAADRERRDRERAEAEARKRQAERDAELAAIRADLPGAMARCGVPPRWTGAELDLAVDLPAEIREAVRLWAACLDGCLLLMGSPGAGKTYAAAAAIRQILRAGDVRPEACCFVSEVDFLESRRPGGEALRPSRAKPHDAALLVFDDLCSTRLTDWSRGELAGLIEHRHAWQLPMILTTNLRLNEIGRALDARIASRLVEDVRALVFPTQDLRLSGQLRSHGVERGGA